MKDNQKNQTNFSLAVRHQSKQIETLIKGRLTSHKSAKAFSEMT
jgi:hypothetical protein